MKKTDKIFIAGHNGLVGKATLDLLKKKGFDTLAGYLITLFERIPSQGDSFSLENLYFEIIEMSDLSIQSVRIIIYEQTKD